MDPPKPESNGNGSVLETDFEKRKRIVENYLKNRSNCIVLKIDTGLIEDDLSPFGFHFEFDKSKYSKKIKEIRRKKFTRWFHLFALYHHKFGIRHLLLVGLIILYTIGGGLMFYEIERDNEEAVLDSMVTQLREQIANLTIESIFIAESNVSESLKYEEISVLIEDYYKAMLSVESKFVGSALHKHQNFDLRRTWSVTSGIFYSMTLFTTIGYGTIACGTILGQALTVVYACIGIPLMLVVLGDVGNLLLRFVTVTYVFFYLKIRRLFFKSSKFEPKETTTTEEFQLPITIAILVIIIYILICAAIVHYFDYKEGVYDGLPIWECIYFSSISFMTIGLGDVMPNNIHYSPFLATMFLFGLAMVGMINSTFYSKIETSFFGFIDIIEKGLERIHRERQTHGYATFLHLSKLFKIAALAVPNIGYMGYDVEYDSKGRRSIGIQIGGFKAETPAAPKPPLPQLLGRMHSERLPTRKSSIPKRVRAPTLGAFGVFTTEPVIVKVNTNSSGKDIFNV